MNDQPSFDRGGAPETSSAPSDAKRKKKKVRSVWIAFVGRIVAQFVGSAATIVLGLMLLHKYQPTKTEAAATQPAKSADQTAPISALTSLTSDTLSVAVLPLHNRGSNPTLQFIADALTDVVTAEVARIPGIHVISRTSATNVRTEQLTLTEISSKLHVRYIVEGSVTHDRDRMRVTAQLIDAARDECIWSGRYDRSARDILSVEEEIAAAIAREVHRALVDADSRGPLSADHRFPADDDVPETAPRVRAARATH
jgi:TolB-like protein